MSNTEKALVALRDQNPDEFGKAIKQLAEIKTLGRDDVAIIRSKDGQARLFRSVVRLSVHDKTLVSVPGVGNLVSAEGYKAQASRAGLFTVNAPSVVVDGQAQPNPYVVRDAKNRVTLIYCRALSFGYNELGVPVVSDRTAIFDLHQYKLVDLLSKAKSTPNDFKILPAGHPGPGKLWAGYELDEATTLWANTESGEYVKWMSQMVNRQRKAVEIAQTFAQRNAIKHHPNIRVHSVSGSEQVVQMLCWRPTDGTIRWDMSQFENTVKQLSEMAVGGGGGDERSSVQVVRGEDEIHQDAELIDAESRADMDETTAKAEGSDDDEGGQEPAANEHAKEPTRVEKLIEGIEEMRMLLDDPKDFDVLAAECKVEKKGRTWRLDLTNETNLIVLSRALSNKFYK